MHHITGISVPYGGAARREAWIAANDAQFSVYVEYTGAAEYDRENGLTGPELPFYLDLTREVGGPALDLACGTGFLTIPWPNLCLRRPALTSRQRSSTTRAAKPGRCPCARYAPIAGHSIWARSSA